MAHCEREMTKVHKQLIIPIFFLLFGLFSSSDSGMAPKLKGENGQTKIEGMARKFFKMLIPKRNRKAPPHIAKDGANFQHKLVEGKDMNMNQGMPREGNVVRREWPSDFVLRHRPENEHKDIYELAHEVVAEDDKNGEKERRSFAWHILRWENNRNGETAAAAAERGEGKMREKSPASEVVETVVGEEAEGKSKNGERGKGMEEKRKEEEEVEDGRRANPKKLPKIRPVLSEIKLDSTIKIADEEGKKGSKRHMGKNGLANIMPMEESGILKSNNNNVKDEGNWEKVADGRGFGKNRRISFADKENMPSPVLNRNGKVHQNMDQMKGKKVKRTQQNSLLRDSNHSNGNYKKRNGGNEQKIQDSADKVPAKIEKKMEGGGGNEAEEKGRDLVVGGPEMVGENPTKKADERINNGGDNLVELADNSKIGEEETQKGGGGGVDSCGEKMPLNERGRREEELGDDDEFDEKAKLEGKNGKLGNVEREKILDEAMAHKKEDIRDERERNGKLEKIGETNDHEDDDEDDGGGDSDGSKRQQRIGGKILKTVLKFNRMADKAERALPDQWGKKAGDGITSARCQVTRGANFAEKGRTHSITRKLSCNP